MKFKICMVGSYAVGKTSLVERYVHSIYSDKYHTTIGVKIDKKEIQVQGDATQCIIWDIAGEDEFYTVNSSYLRGMRGYLLVIDGTRAVTLEIAEGIHDRVSVDYPDVPYVLVINKSDLKDEWEIDESDCEKLTDGAIGVFNTSAKTGAQVEEALSLLAQVVVDGIRRKS